MNGYTKERKCEWAEDDDGAWDTTCGNRYAITEGTPEQNSMKFCTYCGGKLIQKLRGAAIGATMKRDKAFPDNADDMRLS